MQIKIEFSTENAAFEDDPGREIFRILAKAQLKIAAHESTGYSHQKHKLLDVNGNTVGYVEVLT